MEDPIRTSMIQSLKARLALSELETSALAHEVLCAFTPARKKTEALIHRAEVQTKILHLLHDIEALESQSFQWMSTDPVNQAIRVFAPQFSQR